MASVGPGRIMGLARTPACEVKLEIRANNVLDRDFFTKSDPRAVLFTENKDPVSTAHPAAINPEQSSAGVFPNGVSSWRECGRTECINNTLNPHFSTHVTVDYFFEEVQNICIRIWDIDSKSDNLGKHDFLGEFRTTLGDLVASKICTADLTDPDKKIRRILPRGRRNLGTITVIVHEHHEGYKLLVRGRFSGKKLARKDLFSSDPYLIFAQVGMHSERSSSELYRTEFIKRKRNPDWEPVTFKVDLPNGGDFSDIHLKLTCNDKDNLTSDDEIGVAECTLEELRHATSFPLIDYKKKGRRGYTNSGQIIVHDLSVLRMPTVIEYLQGGLKINFTVAIDMTSSNGQPHLPKSLHFQGPTPGGNQYVNALLAIGNVLQTYAPNDNLFSAYGFGAQLPGQYVASSCFPLNLQKDPRCHGVQGILSAYTHALNNVRLSGPTNFSPLIETVARNAARRPNDEYEQNYDVLLIMTDGVITDFNRTVDKIINASFKAPLSIIIIGVGAANFDKMRYLDADNDLLTSVDGKRTAARDIVQFVPFREYLTAPLDRLAATVLRELPDNIIDYFMFSRCPRIMPGNAPMLPGTQQNGLPH